MAARSLGGRDQTLGIGERGRHRFFQQHVLAGRERLHGHVDMQMIGRDDVDQLPHLDPRAVHRGCDEPARPAGRAPLPGPRRRRLRPRRSAKSLDTPDRARMHATPATVSHQTDAHLLSRRPTSGQYVTVSPKGERRRGGPQPSQREKVVRRGRGRAWRRPRNRRPRIRRLRRPLGLRQKHHAAHDRRTRGHHLRRDFDRRPDRQRARSQGPRHRHGVPGLRALPAHDGVREHGVLRCASAADRGEIHRRVDEAARILDIEPYSARMPRQLSGGQRQRVAMGRAIVRDPKVFLFDEPLSNLDAKLRVQMRAEISACANAWARPRSTSRTTRSRP